MHLFISWLLRQKRPAQRPLISRQEHEISRSSQNRLMIMPSVLQRKEKQTLLKPMKRRRLLTRSERLQIPSLRLQIRSTCFHLMLQLRLQEQEMQARDSRLLLLRSTSLPAAHLKPLSRSERQSTAYRKPSEHFQVHPESCLSSLKRQLHLITITS